MKAFRLGCKTMKDGILVSGVFFAMAVGLILLARTLVPDVAYMPDVVMGLGMLLLCFAPLILLGTWLRSATSEHGPNDPAGGALGHH
jgi:hypothetical protein